MKRKTSAAVSMLFIAFSLSACSDLNEWIADKALEKSGITENENYKSYQEHLKENRLDSDGKYIYDELWEAVPAMASHSPSINVYVSENNRLSVSYYADENRTSEIDPNGYSFSNGSVIYVSAAEANADEPLYRFERFRVYDLDENGNVIREMNDVWDSKASVLRIPDDYTGKSISVEPIGEYVKCRVTFEAFLKDAGNGKSSVSASWTVDGMPYTSSTAELDPSANHDVTVKFDSENYYYSSDSTEGFDCEVNRYENTVEFRNISLKREECSFSVELRRYITCQFDSQSGIEAIRINDGSFSGKAVTKLKTGDKISLDLKKDHIAECMQFDYQNSEIIGGIRRVTFVIPEINEDIKIITAKESDGISEHNGIFYSHAVMTVSTADTGYILKDGDKISGSARVIVEITPEAGYYLGGYGVKDNRYCKEMKYSEFIKIKDKLRTEIDTSDEPIKEKNILDRLNPFNW